MLSVDGEEVVILPCKVFEIGALGDSIISQWFNTDVLWTWYTCRYCWARVRTNTGTGMRPLFSHLKAHHATMLSEERDSDLHKRACSAMA